MALITTGFFLQLFGVIIAIVGAAYIYIKHVTYNYWRSRGIIQPECITPFGNLWPVFSSKKSMGKLIADTYEQFKKNSVFGMYSIVTPTLVICDPDLIRFVLTKEFSRFQDRGVYYNEKIDPLSAHLFAVAGPKWRNLRVKFTPTFTSGKMKQMFTTVKECSDNLALCVVNEMKQNELIEIRDVMARFTTDVITSVAFGIECNSLRDPNAEFRSWSRKIFAPKLVLNTLTTFFPPLLSLFNVRITDKGASDFFIKIFKETVEYRTTHDVVRKDFLNLVMQLINRGYVEGDDGKPDVSISEDANGKVTMLEGAAQAWVFWLAGFETSSTTATYTLYELALNQKIQDKLAAEIDRVLDEYGGVTYESVHAMPYLHKVVSETLRKYPVVPFLNRECNRDTDLPGTNLNVKKGTAIVIPLLGIQMDPDIYPEPERYDPERFSEENIASRHAYTYMPFGEGPRNCIGMRFGLLQAKIGLISILSKLSVHPGPNTKVPLPIDKGNFIYCPEGGVPLRFKERNG